MNRNSLLRRVIYFGASPRARLVKAVEIKPQGAAGVNELHRDGPGKEFTGADGKGTEQRDEDANR